MLQSAKEDGETHCLFTPARREYEKKGGRRNLQVSSALALSHSLGIANRYLRSSRISYSSLVVLIGACDWRKSLNVTLDEAWFALE